jgi:GT2 family glycosyltransferase
MNRAHDLKKTMSYLIKAANASPSVEILVLNYNSNDDLDKYINKLKKENNLVKGNKLSYLKYTGRDYYHIAHAWNLAVLSSCGEYVVIMGADAMPAKNFVKVIRKLIAEHDYVWMHGSKLTGITVIQRKEFISAGGYDERFEFYGGEDKDLAWRLRRRKAKFGKIPSNLLSVIRTSNSDKVKNYRVKMDKTEMILHNKIIRDENCKNKVLIANKGKEWGQWK